MSVQLFPLNLRFITLYIPTLLAVTNAVICQGQLCYIGLAKGRVSKGALACQDWPAGCPYVTGPHHNVSVSLIM